MDGLTPIQENCFRTIARYLKQERRPPTRRELAQLIGQKSTHGVNQILDALVKKGCIQLAPPNQARNITLSQASSNQAVLGKRSSETDGQTMRRPNTNG